MKQYLDLVKEVLNRGTRKENRTGVDTISAFNINYSINGGTTLAGITNSPNLFGINSKFKSPGWDFVLGSQNSNISIKMSFAFLTSRCR